MYDLLIGLALGGVALAAGVFVGSKIGKRQRDEKSSGASEPTSE